MNNRNRMEKITPPALLEKYETPPIVTTEHFFPSIKGSLKTLSEGDAIKLPESVTSKFQLAEMKKAKSTIGKIVLRDESVFIQVVIDTVGSPITREFPATNPMFGLGKLPESFETKEAKLSEETVGFNEKLSYAENREALLAKVDNLEEERQKLRDLYWQLKKSLPIAEQIKMDAATEEEALSIIRGGLDRVVIHGAKKVYDTSELGEEIHRRNQSENSHEKGEQVDVIQPDIDIRGAMYLLNLFAEIEGITVFKENAFTESVPKGSQKSEPTRQGETAIAYMDTSGEDFSIQKGGNLYEIFGDHHNPTKNRATSTTEIYSRILSRSPKFKQYLEENLWLQKFIEFTVDADNLKYVDKKSEDGRGFNKRSFTENWPRSFYALIMSLNGKKVIPFEVLLQAFKDKKHVWKTYTDEEIEKGITYKNSNGEDVVFDLKNAVAVNKETAEKTMKGIEKAQDFQKEAGIKTETAELGKVVYHNFAKMKNKGGNGYRKNEIPKGLAFVGTKAAENDTFVSYSPKEGKFFVNSSKKDLTPTYDRLKKLYPGLTLVRGVMIFAPEDPQELKNVTEEQFLRAVGLK